MYGPTEGLTESQVREIVRDELMKLCLKLEPAKRPTMDGVAIENKLTLSVGPAAIGDESRVIDSVFLGY